LAGFLDALRAFLNPPATVQRGLVQEQLWNSGDIFGSSTGKRVDTDSALKSIAVQAAVRLLVNDIGSLPIDAFRATGARQPLPRPSWMVAPIPTNPNVTWEDHVKQVVFSMLTDGNAFVYCFPSVKRPQGLRALDPKTVDIKGDIGMGETIYQVSGVGGLTPNEILHIPWVIPPGKNRGLNPIEAAKEGIGIALAADEFVGSYFGNGAILSGYIKFPQGMEPTEEQLKALKADFKLKHVGSRKSHAVGALTGGAEFEPFDYNNRDAQLLELREQIVEEVARLFGIPPHMLGSQRPGAVSYASVEQRSIDYVTHAVLPIVNRVEIAYRRLLPSTDAVLKFNLNGLLRADHKSRWDAYGVALDKRTVTVDEIRALEDLEPLGEDNGGGFLNTPNNTAADPRIEAVGSLIRAGFDPTAALEAVGLAPIQHLGLPPVTVQSAKEQTPAQEPAA